MSTTAASLGTVPLARRASSAIVGSRPAGRLSATNQSRSSSDFAAVLRPAPDMPVIMTISWPELSPFIICPPIVAIAVRRPGRVACTSPVAGMQRRVHALGSDLAESGRLRYLLRRRGRQLAQRAELPQQRSPASRAEAGHGVQLAGRE